MEIMKITDTSIKISLCATEAQEYNLNEECQLDTKEVKKSFARLLSKAKKEVGFKYAGENIVAEIFSSKDGGYEIFVSCLNLEEKMYREKANSEKIQRQAQSVIYSFDELEDLLLVSSRLAKLELGIKSSLYLDESSKKYYLILDGVSKKDAFLGFISEYAMPVKSNHITYIYEYTKCIVKGNAISRLV
jgi:negative regulator of genetic competence, sporulation and motility